MTYTGFCTLCRQEENFESNIRTTRSVNRRKTDNIMGKRKYQKDKQMVHETQHRKHKIEKIPEGQTNGT